jgi:flavin-dependent dehydrogenase
MINVRRTTLDPILVGAARQAGATIRDRARVAGVIWEDGCAVGVRGQDESGAAFEERGRLLVGADGRHSLVAREVQAPEYNQVECPTGAIYAYYGGIGPSKVGTEVLQVAFGPQCMTLCCPCDGGLHVILLAVPAAEFNQMHANDVGAFESRLRTVTTLAPRLNGAQMVGKLHPAGMREVRGYFRRPFGPGWALVGDSGAVPHPALGHGIADALRSAELLHDNVEAAWAAGQPPEARLENYQRTRDAENTGLYYFSFRLSQVDPWRDPQVAAMLSGQARPPMPAAATAQA